MTMNKASRSRFRSFPILVLILVILGIAGTFLWNWYDNNVDRSGWVQNSQGYIYRDFHGKAVTGWQSIDGNTYHFREDHLLSTGWQTLEDRTYYFGSSGAMHTGWLDAENNRYYLSSDGALCTGWQDIDGSRYYFAADGTMSQGWMELDGSRYFFRDGVMVTGWQEIDGNRHCFSPDGQLLLGWQEVEGSTYYFREDGTPVTGTATIRGNSYRFREDGTMVTGWVDTDSGKTFYLEDGSQAFGWAEVEGKRYYFGDDGMLLTGWLQEGEYSYYLQEDGSAAVGPLKIDGQTHYFTPKGIHVVLVNAANPVPSYYKVNLVTVTGWHQVADVCLEPLVQMLADCNAAGFAYNFNSAHRTIAEQTMILDMRTEEYMDTGMTYEAARAKALKSVAYPGTSEHHLGLAVDLLNQPAIEWLTEHCWDYGFIVRYTADKYPITGIIDEPWHFRYVGREVALDMKDSGLCLEEYLGAA